MMVIMVLIMLIESDIGGFDHLSSACILCPSCEMQCLHAQHNNYHCMVLMLIVTLKANLYTLSTS